MMNDEKKGVIAHYILSNIYEQAICETLGIHSVTAIVKYNYNGLICYENGRGMFAYKPSLEKCRLDWMRKIEE